MLLGTRTTIEAGVHREGLERRGIDSRRIAAVSCHGLAGAIERDVDGPRTADLIGECIARAAEAAPPGGTVFLGLCCTHYGYVAARLTDSVARQTSRLVLALDPNGQLTSSLLADAGFFEAACEAPAAAVAPGATAAGTVSVDLVSKVALPDLARAGIARLVAPVSAVTADALLSYAHVPDLF